MSRKEYSHVHADRVASSSVEKQELFEAYSHWDSNASKTRAKEIDSDKDRVLLPPALSSPHFCFVLLWSMTNKHQGPQTEPSPEPQQETKCMHSAVQPVKRLSHFATREIQARALLAGTASPKPAFLICDSSGSSTGKRNSRRQCLLPSNLRRPRNAGLPGYQSRGD